MNMKITTLMDVYNCLKGRGGEEIHLPQNVLEGAGRCISRMVELGADGVKSEVKLDKTADSRYSNLDHAAGEIAVPCTCNPATARVSYQSDGFYAAKLPS